MSRKALDTERQWRRAAERIVAQTAANLPPNISPLPPRELQGLLENEYLVSPQPAPAATTDGNELAATVVRSKAN
jgi:hypothetical protein